MINFDSLTLKALIREIEPILTSGRVQKIQQPSKNSLLLSIRALGKNHKLYASVDPKYPHVALLSDIGEISRNIEIPQKPPMFCMLLRKHMEGAKIREVRQPEYERILELYFDSYNEIGDRIPLVLAIELMGKHSNIVLYNYDNNVILGSAHFVSSEKSREREIAGGLPYVYPPKPDKLDLLKISQSEFLGLVKAIQSPIDAWLNEKFNYISLALASEFCNVTGINTEKDRIIATSKEKILELYDLAVKTLKLENLNPSISEDKKLFSLIGLDPYVKWERQNSVNSMTDLYFGYQIYIDNFTRLKSNLLTQLNKELKKQKTKLAQYNKAAESGEKAEKYKQYADLLMANLYKIETGEEKVELENFYEDNKPVQITLDSSITPSANAQRYYKLYSKAKNASLVSKKLADEAQEYVNYLESINLSINQAETMDDLNQIQEELINQNIIKQSKKAEKGRKIKPELTQYRSSDGYSIYLGRNNKQNEYLISKIASGEDIWFHAQNIPGSHVLIKVPPENPEAPENTILEAARLAAYYSQAKESSKVPVVYVKRKFLKKPPGSNPGYVTFTHEKTIIVSPEESLDNKL